MKKKKKFSKEFEEWWSEHIEESDKDKDDKIKYGKMYSMAVWELKEKEIIELKLKINKLEEHIKNLELIIAELTANDPSTLFN